MAMQKEIRPMRKNEMTGLSSNSATGEPLIWRSAEGEGSGSHEGPEYDNARGAGQEALRSYAEAIRQAMSRGNDWDSMNQWRLGTQLPMSMLYRMVPERPTLGKGYDAGRSADISMQVRPTPAGTAAGMSPYVYDNAFSLYDPDPRYTWGYGTHAYINPEDTMPRETWITDERGRNLGRQND